MRIGVGSGVTVRLDKKWTKAFLAYLAATAAGDVAIGTAAALLVAWPAAVLFAAALLAKGVTGAKIAKKEKCFGVILKTGLIGPPEIITR